jgi:hypothetical protein
VLDEQGIAQLPIIRFSVHIPEEVVTVGADIPRELIIVMTVFLSSSVALVPIAKVEAASPTKQGVFGMTLQTRAPLGSSASNVSNCIQTRVGCC